MSTESSPNTRLHLAIVGGGIAGLVLAISLAQYQDIHIDIYEGATKFETIGAGLLLWGDCLTVFKNLGILDRLATIAPAHESFVQLRRANLEEGETFGKLDGSRLMGFHRAQLLDELVKILEETKRAKIHFGKRCLEYAPSDVREELLIQFQDGSIAGCDVLIGADGIRSAVRKQLVQDITGKEGSSTKDKTVDTSGLRFTCTVGYRFLINPVNLPNHPARSLPIQYCGRNKHMVSYPVAGGKLINALGYSSNPERLGEWMNGPWTTDVDRSEVQKEFSDFEPQVQELLNAIDEVSRWALYEVDPLPQWTKGNVVILGDACHAMPPFIGAGGGQTIEDAYVLARLLGYPAVTRKDIPLILQCYQSIRKPRVDKVLECTRAAKRAYEFMDEYADASNDQIKSALNSSVVWLQEGKYDIDADIEKGKKEFDRLRAEAEGR